MCCTSHNHFSFNHQFFDVRTTDFLLRRNRLRGFIRHLVWSPNTLAFFIRTSYLPNMVVETAYFVSGRRQLSSHDKIISYDEKELQVWHLNSFFSCAVGKPRAWINTCHPPGNPLLFPTLPHASYSSRSLSSDMQSTWTSGRSSCIGAILRFESTSSS